jgi:hypothetical protein
VISGVKRRVTPGAVVHALGGMVLIVLASTWALGALLAKDAELLYISG